MQIHVVQRGQSLFRIAHTYGTTVEAIVKANGLSEPNRLVIGQALVIPVTGSFYWVQPGDTLYDIARRLGVSYLTIAAANRIETNRLLRTGVRLFIPPLPKRNAEIVGFVETSGKDLEGDAADAVKESAPDVSCLAPCSFRIQRDGTLKPPLLERLPALASENSVGLIMIVTNLENGRCSAEFGGIVLHDLQLQHKLLDHMMASVEEVGFRGVHFDMECLPLHERDAYHAFLRRAGDRLHAEGRTVSISLSPKMCVTWQDCSLQALDYKAFGEIADYIVIKSSEWRSSEGKPVPAFSFGMLRRVLRYAVKEMPATKIMVEQHMSGYDWTLPCSPAGSGIRELSTQEAIELAVRENAFIRYDYGFQTPYFDYIDEAGKHHQVWFEDARSVRAKFNLVRELGLRGVMLRKPGLPFPQERLLVREYFDAVKRE